MLSTTAAATADASAVDTVSATAVLSNGSTSRISVRVHDRSESAPPALPGPSPSNVFTHPVNDNAVADALSRADARGAHPAPSPSLSSSTSAPPALDSVMADAPFRADAPDTRNPLPISSPTTSPSVYDGSNSPSHDGSVFEPEVSVLSAKTTSGGTGSLPAILPIIRGALFEAMDAVLGTPSRPPASGAGASAHGVHVPGGILSTDEVDDLYRQSLDDTFVTPEHTGFLEPGSPYPDRNPNLSVAVNRVLDLTGDKLTDAVNSVFVEHLTDVYRPGYNHCGYWHICTGCQHFFSKCAHCTKQCRGVRVFHPAKGKALFGTTRCRQCYDADVPSDDEHDMLRDDVHTEYDSDDGSVIFVDDNSWLERADGWMVVFLLQMSEADQARVRLISAQVQARNTERQRLRVQLDTAVQAEQLERLQQVQS